MFGNLIIPTRQQPQLTYFSCFCDLYELPLCGQKSLLAFPPLSRTLPVPPQRVHPPDRPLDGLRHLLRPRPVRGNREQVRKVLAGAVLAKIKEGHEADPEGVTKY